MFCRSYAGINRVVSNGPPLPVYNNSFSTFPFQIFPSRSSSSHSLPHRLPVLHFPSATVSNFTLRPLDLTPSTPPASNHRCKFLHWLTSNTSRSLHPSTTASTPVPVTRTQPRTDRLRSSRRWRLMQRRDVSETAEPQNARLRCVSEGRPRARTSVAVSERAQQKDCKMGCEWWFYLRVGDGDHHHQARRKTGDLPDLAPSTPSPHS